MSPYNRTEGERLYLCNENFARTYTCNLRRNETTCRALHGGAVNNSFELRLWKNMHSTAEHSKT